MPYSGAKVYLPLGLAGLTGKRNYARMAPDVAIVADNVSFYNDMIRREGGADKYNASAITGTPVILAGYDWRPDSGNQFEIIFDNGGALRKDNGAGVFSVTLASGLTHSGTLPMFVEGGAEVAANNKKLFFFSGKNPVQVVDGTANVAAAITAPPADWAAANQPVCGAIHEGRLWGAGNGNDPHRVYASLATDHEDFTTTPLSISVYPGVGDGIKSVISFRGLLVVLKKPYGIFLIDTSNSDTAQWRATQMTDKIGVAGPRAWTFVDQDVIFMDANSNIHALTAVDAFGDVSASTLGRAQDISGYMRDNFDLSCNCDVTAVNYEHKGEVIFTHSSSGATWPDRRITMDFTADGTARFKTSSRDVNASLWLYQDSDTVFRPLIGDDSGFIWKLDQDTFNKDGDPYTSEIRTPHMDLSFVDINLGPMRKNFHFLELQIEPATVPGDIVADVFIDGQWAKSVMFGVGGNGATLGSFVIGTDRLADLGVGFKRKKLDLSGKTIGISIVSNGADVESKIAAVWLYFQPADETLAFG